MRARAGVNGGDYLHVAVAVKDEQRSDHVHVDDQIDEGGAELGGDAERWYRAVAARDRRFEGRFVVAVRSTGVYCRPGCPARLPLARNVRFFRCAAAAEAAGFRPCLRCRPDAQPGSPAWLGTSATVQRALRLIAEDGLRGGVGGLAERLGVGERHLRRLFAEELGASPLEVARTRRAHFARKLLEETALPMAEVAAAAGYASLRRFNAEVRDTFRRAPSELRRRPLAPAGLTLRLPYREPYDWEALVGFLAARAIPGLERVEGGVYRRVIPGGSIAVEPEPGQAALRLTVCGDAGVAGLKELVERAGRLFDLGAQPHAVRAQLERAPRLRRLVRARPGLRVPGAWDPFEVMVRAVIGQQVSVAAARTVAARLTQRFGRAVPSGVDGLTHSFPEPARLAAADPEALPMPRARGRALVALARAVAERGSPLELPEGLCGIGPWTASYVALRLGDPDAFPASDLGLRRALGLRTPRAVEAWAEPVRPFRAYAALHLWCEELA